MMKKKLLPALLGLFFAASAPLMAQSSGPQLNTYQSTPFFLDGQTIPHVMLVLERDWKMFYPAYNNLADLDGDGALDIGFNPKVTYVGYFDSNSCYEYQRNGFNPNASNDERGYFVRARATTAQTQAEADALAASKGIDLTSLDYPASAHGVCGGGGTRSQGLGLWHGNWLNYAMTSRMDAIRKVLYGGKRTTDTPTQTILEMVRVPANANVWGGEIYANDIWESYAPSSPWYDVEKFTGFFAPENKTMHFWARGDYFWRAPIYTTSTPSPSTTTTNQSNIQQNSKPLFRFVSNVPSANRHPFLKVPLRIWDWSGDHASYNSIPSDGHLANSKNAAGNTQNSFMAGTVNVAWNFAARVEVCKSGNISPTEGCQNYQGNYKPIGLLQEYGESSRMFFGLLTGTVSHPSPYGVYSGTRYKGGVVRHHIQEFNNYVNANGTIVRPGLINTIDVFEITGISSSRSYSDGSQAGNPLGEMVWEAVRYLGGGAIGLGPTSDYGATGSESPVTSVTDGSFFLTKSGWNSRPTLGGNANDCPKPIILAISEVYPDHDGDDYPNLNDLSYAPRSSFASGVSSKVPIGQFSISDYLQVITNQENLKTSANQKLFFYPDSRGLCSAKSLGGLGDINGHCPSEPSLEGTYNLAAVTYYAHTHDFTLPAGTSADGAPKTKEANIDFYAVGIAGNFPDITLTVSNNSSLTLMPIALTSPLDANNAKTEGETDPGFRTLLNFFIEYWQTDDGHNYQETDDKGNTTTKFRKIPYKVKFRTNFEFTLYPCFVYGGNSNNWERDLFNAFTISLLTDKSTPRDYREAEPLYINSGPFKTRNRQDYLNDRANYRAAASFNPNVDPDNYFRDDNGQKYYYAFKRKKGETLDISRYTVAGVTIHSDSTGAGYGAGGQTGYTITGVQHPGAYLDVGLNRSDYPIYFSRGSNCQPSQLQFVPNPITSCGDEDVPLDPSGSGLPGAQWDYQTYGMHNTPSGFNNHSSGSTVYTNNADCGYYHPPTMRDDLLTPAECPYADYSDSDVWTDADLIAAYNPRPKAENVCGKWAAGYSGTISNKSYPTSNSLEGNLFRTSLMRYVQVRSFKFDTSANRPESLPDPMWLAAKYGGFKDIDNNGVPDRDLEWKRMGSGIGANDPYNYFRVANMSELPTQLGKAFEAIANSVATGTANAASISQVLGGGISLQTQYRTSYQANGAGDDASKKITWAGTTYAFFIDKWGNLRADTNGNGKLDLRTSPADPNDWEKFNPNTPRPNPYTEQGDLIVHMVAPAGTGLPTVYLCRDPNGDNNGGNSLPTDVGRHPSDGGYPPYSACEKKDSLDEVQALWNVAQRISDMNVANRRLYTYLGDNKGDGTAWTGGVDFKSYEFKSTVSQANLDKLHLYMGQTSKAEMSDLIEYSRGVDFPGKYRERTIRLPWDNPGAPAKVWRMGDVINSRPVIVGEPSSNYHLLFGDASYYAYQTTQARRRQVAYFGSNDGILHAANVGFFGALADGQAGYSVLPFSGPVPSPNYNLGDEMWGYIPPSLLPHLQWMANEAYQHSYYVDLKPYIFDVKDGNNWRTIMIVGLRLGGAPIELVNGDSVNRYTTPEFFAMDVTDPESPSLLWRYSDPTLGQSTAQPVVVRSGYDNKWYVLLPSGPVQMENGQLDFDKASELYAGRSTQKAKVIVLDVLNGEYARSRDKNPGSAVGNDPLTVEEPNSFFNDSYVPRALNAATAGGVTTWGNYVAYLSLASVRNSDTRDSGAVYRVQMVNPVTGAHLPPDNWQLTRFYKTDKPVTAAMNSSYDQVGNLWVFFGTGRIWSKDDMTPCGLGAIAPDCEECYEQYLFGIKEPLNSNGAMTFDEVPQDVDIIDVSAIQVYPNGDLKPQANNTGKTTYEAHYYNMLSKTAAGVPTVRGYKWKIETWRRDANNYDSDLDGYVNPHPVSFEMINTQVKVDALANGRLNATVTTYVPSDNICEPLGESFIIVFDAFAGLPAPYMDVYGGILGNEITVNTGGTGGTTTKYQEVTGVKRVGAGMASEVAIRKTESGTRYETVGFAGQRVGFDIPGGMSVGPGFISWREVLDMRFDLKEDTDALFKDLKP